MSAKETILQLNEQGFSSREIARYLSITVFAVERVLLDAILDKGETCMNL